MRVVLLRLEGPLQAWSTQGRLGVRDTEREPTKSGVLGLVGAALGMGRDDEETLSRLAALPMGVRVDRAGTLLRDFHTAGGGSFRGRPYFVHGTTGCVPSERYYLQDASFVAGLEADEDAALRIAGALQEPRFPLFLGRRSCPPSSPMLIGVTGGPLYDALTNAPLAERADPAPHRMVLEVASGGDSRDDVPLSFASGGRRYGRRYVQTRWSPPTASLEVSA
jgi:CRISPR system Cascade subunit CasD